MKRWLVAAGLLVAGCFSPALAAPKLGTLAPDPGESFAQRPDRYVVALYSHDCGDLTGLWEQVLQLKIPVLAINAEGIPAAAPPQVPVLRGETATQYARQVRVTVYPTLLLVEDGVVVGLWEAGGTGIPETLGQLDLK